MSRYCGHIIRWDDDAPLVSTLKDEDGNYSMLIHPEAYDLIHLPNAKKVFGTIGFDDAKLQPCLTMAAVISELRESLAQAWAAQPSADAMVMLEVPRNMTQSDIDFVCGVHAKRIIVRRTDDVALLPDDLA
jgi:hypothetical protein